MKINKITDEQGFEYNNAEINLSTTGIPEGQRIKYVVILTIVPYRRDEEGNIIFNYGLSIKEVIPDLMAANSTQQVMVSFIGQVIEDYLKKKGI